MRVRRAVSAVWFGLRNTYEELFTIAGVNLTWLGIGFAIPTLVAYLGQPFVALVLLLITVPPPTAGAFYYANRIAREKSANFSDFWEGTKKYAVRAWIFGVVDVLALGLFVLNIWFYPRAFQGMWVIWVQSVFVALTVYWLALQIYIWPILLEQKEEKLRLAVRNAAVLAFSNPLMTLIVGLALLLIIAVSLALTLPAVFVMICTVALIANRAVVLLLEPYREQAEAGTEATSQE